MKNLTYFGASELVSIKNIMLIDDIKNKIPKVIRYTHITGFKRNKTAYDYKDLNGILISDYFNIPMKCFENRFGVWNDSRPSRERILEL